jgi:2-polyprenyl-3-methyl-5-hydroxy-6-metoxy-1,4-benzoquinol methylase
MVVCEHCGAAFYDTPSRQSDYDRYYRGNAYYYTSENIGSGGSTPADRQRFAALARRLAPCIPRPDAAIFDIGCAKGGLLAVLAEHGHERLYGVDMLPSCIDYVRKVRGMAAEIGSALALPFPEVRADVLIYSHIVEHVIDLQMLMTSASEKLSEDGIVYVEVPDASRYGEGSVHPYQDLYLEHVNHFDRATLVSQFQAGGFSAVSTGETLLEALPQGGGPCLWGIFRKGGCPEATIDRSLEGRLRDYLAWSQQHPAMERFAQLARERTPLYVWGISQYAMLLLGQTDLHRCALQGFVDKDPYKQRRTLGGRPIRPPEALRDVGPPSAVLITAPGYEDQIAASLREMGFRGTILTTSGEPRQS